MKAGIVGNALNIPEAIVQLGEGFQSPRKRAHAGATPGTEAGPNISF